MDDIEISELRAFTRIVELGSLSRAAEDLGVPRATVGRRLARLEERLGARLIRRTTRSLTLTDEGRAFYERATVALDAVREAVSSVQRNDGALRGKLKISIPPIPGPSFQAFVADFLARHPGVSIVIDASHATVRLTEESYDLAVRASAALDPGLVRRSIMEDRIIAVASPAYLAERGTPKSANELATHACLLDFARGRAPRREWPLLAGGVVRVDGPLASNDLHLALSAAISGLGIALLPESLSAAPLESGKLVRVLEDEVGAVAHIAVVYPERELVRPLVRAFADELVAWGKRELPKLPTVCHQAAHASAAG